MKLSTHPLAIAIINAQISNGNWSISDDGNIEIASGSESKFEPLDQIVSAIQQIEMFENTERTCQHCEKITSLESIIMEKYETWGVFYYCSPACKYDYELSQGWG